MSKHQVPIKQAGDPAGHGLFQKIEAALDSIRQRAYELFHARDGSPGEDLDDWFKAERELFEVPDGDIRETADAFVVSMNTPGFTAEQLDVAVESTCITICGEAEKKTGTEFRRKSLFRRFDLPRTIDTEKVKASLVAGHLTISMPKAGKATVSASIAA